MPGPVEVLSAQIKKQLGSRYRLISLESSNVVDKKVRGFEFLGKEDPEVKGTILEKHTRADGLVAIGDLALAKISEADARKHEAIIQAKKDRRLQAIKRTYKSEEEKIKRKLGKHHKDFKIIMKEED